MIKFTYEQKIEAKIFADYIQAKKDSVIIESVKAKLSIPIKKSNKLITQYIDLTHRQWRNVADKFLTALGGFYEQKLPEPNIYCYLIRLNTFPYNFDQSKDQSWFSAPLFISPPERNRVVMHELCHFFQPVLLPRPIKEAIPVILNDHERFGMYSFDRGHSDPEEQKWRKIIWEIYNQGGKFSEILNNVDKYH